MTKSRSFGSRPAMSRAFLAACNDRSRNLSSPVKTRRSAIPVLVKIHSSDVSTTFSKSAFVITVLGVALPIPLRLTLIFPDTACRDDVVEAGDDAVLDGCEEAAERGRKAAAPSVGEHESASRRTEVKNLVIVCFVGEMLPLETARYETPTTSLSGFKSVRETEDFGRRW